MGQCRGKVGGEGQGRGCEVLGREEISADGPGRRKGGW